MSTIQVNCVDQVLSLTGTPTIASGGILEDYVSFKFCSQWDGFYKTAVFWRSPEGLAYHVVLDSTNKCLIPAEVLEEDGTVYFGVYGVNDAGVRRTSNVLRYTIELGVITVNTQPSDPTPDVYTQILESLAALGDNKGKADKVGNPVEGDLAGLDANGNLTDSGRKPGAANGVATLDETGKVPTNQILAPVRVVAITLYAASWSNKTQSAIVNGVLADETMQLIQPAPALASQSAYHAAGITCTGQAENNLTFTATKTPTEDLTVYVAMQEVRV